MERNEKTMKNLYRGLGYEYYTASQLWMMGYEAYKMDADFGFDIMAYNQKERSFSNETAVKSYVFQVKSRKIYEFDTHNAGAGIRWHSEQEFYFSKDDFLRIIAEENAYIICYFVNGIGEHETIEGMFWLNCAQIRKMYNRIGLKQELTWFKEKGDKVILKASITSQADSKEIILDKIKEIYSGIEECMEFVDTSNNDMNKKIRKIIYKKESLDSWINRCSITNNNSNVLVTLVAEDNKGRERTRQIRTAQTVLENFEQPYDKLPFSDCI